MGEKNMGKSRPGLTRELVVREAVDLADQHGMEKLSMRKLAGVLGVEAMSLYNHVKNKEDLTKAMLDQVTSGFSLPEELVDWQNFLFYRCQSMHQTLLAHPWSSMTLMSTFYDGPGFLGFMDKSYGFLVQSGFSLIQADGILNAVDSFTYGYVLQKLNFPIPDDQMQATAGASMDLVPQESLPNLYSLTSLVAQGEYSGLFEYEFGLELMIRGLEQEKK
jgi:AcrR family transcriptional regulator